MGIKRLLIDSRIQGIWTVWYGHIKTGPDRRRNREEGRPRATARGCRVRDASLQQHVQWFNDCCGSQAVRLSVLGGHSNDSMGGLSTPLM